MDTKLERERVWISLLTGKGYNKTSSSVIDVIKQNEALANDTQFMNSIAQKEPALVVALANVNNKRDLDLLFGSHICWGPYKSTEEYRVNFLNKTEKDI